MANYSTLGALFTAIANSIRGKTGGTGQIKADNFPSVIDTIVTDPSGSCTATDSDILSGKTAYAGGVLRTGNIASYTDLS